MAYNYKKDPSFRWGAGEKYQMKPLLQNGIVIMTAPNTYELTAKGKALDLDNDHDTTLLDDSVVTHH